MEACYDFMYINLFKFEVCGVSLQTFQETILRNIESYLNDNTEVCELDVNVFHHLIDPLTIQWEELFFKPRDPQLFVDKKNIDLLLKNKSLLYFINGLIDISLSNQLFLQKTFLYDIYQPLKQFLNDSKTYDTNYKYAFMLLRNLVKHGDQLFNKQFSYNDVDLNDIKIFLELNFEFQKKENHDFVLLKNSQLLVEKSTKFNYLKFQLQFPVFYENENINIFNIKSSISNLNVFVSSNGISILQLEDDNFKNVEVHKQDICFDSSQIYTFIIEKKEDMIKLYMEEVPMSFCFYEEQMEKLFLGKHKATNNLVKCFCIERIDEVSLEKTNLLQSHSFEELTSDGLLASEGIFQSHKKENLKRVYQNCDIFKKIINFSNNASADVFFADIYKILINNRDLICSYNVETDSHLMKRFINAVFLMIDQKIVGFDKAGNVFKDLLDYLLHTLKEKHDQYFLKQCFSCISKWANINELYFITVLMTMFDPLANDSTLFEFELVEWIEANIKMFDNFLNTISLCDKGSSKLKKAISATIRNIVDCIIVSKNSTLLTHMMQKCVYYIEINKDEGLFFSALLIDAITKAIIHGEKHHISKTLNPITVDMSFLLIDISLSKNESDFHPMLFEKSLLLYCVIVKSCPEVYAQFTVNGPLKLLGKAHELNEKKNYVLLNSFCKVICFSSFSFKTNETLFLDYEFITDCDVSIFKSFEKEYIEFHLLLLKVFAVADCTKLPFFFRYHEIVGSLIETEKYQRQIFNNECRVIISLITIAMVENDLASSATKILLIKLLKLSMIYIPNDIFEKLSIVMNSDNYESGHRNFARAYKKWVIFQIFPKLCEELIEVHSTLLVENITYGDNFKTLLGLVGTLFTVYEFNQKFLLNLTNLVFAFLYNSSESRYLTLAAKLLSVICSHNTYKNEEVAMAVISNQHIILTEDAFTAYFIQIFEFIVLNYINTTENKDEKFAFIRLQMSTIEHSYNSAFLSKIPIFTGGDFPIKNLLNKMNKLDDSKIKKTLVENEQEFLEKLSKKSAIYVFESPNFAADMEKKQHSLASDTLIAKTCIESFEESLENLAEHIMTSEAKNLQIRSIDEDDEIEASQKFLNNCDYYMFKIKTSYETSEISNEIFRLKLHRSTNSLMQRKVFTPNKLVKDMQEITNPANLLTTRSFKFSKSSTNTNISQNSRVIKKLALNESIKHIWNTCIVVGVNIENGILILTDKNVLFYNQYFYRENEGAIIKRNEMTAEEEKELIALKFEESYSKNKGDLEPEIFISVSKADILYSLKRVFLFKDIACEFSDKYNYSYFFTFADKTMRDFFYNETNTSLVFTSLNHDLSKSKNVFEKIFEGINIESSEIINKNGIGAFSFTSKLTSVFHSLVSEDYKLEKITSDWAAGRISNFFYLLAINFYAGRSFNDITQYPVFPWIISNYSDEEINLDDPQNFRDLTRPMGGQNESRKEQFIERFKSMQELDDELSPPFHYGTHYSSAMIVASYLIRIEPYTTSFKILQGGSFGPPDRIFNSIERSWLSASKELSTDIRELIPEFFFLPEFLQNINHINFGATQSGHTIEDVHLPKWSNGSSSAFVYKNLEALESDYVSDNLDHWIDLVFGYKQRGQEAINSVNVFNQLSYSGYTPIKDSASDDFDLTSSVIHNFGQTPLQLFITKHPKRSATHFNKGLISINKEHKQVLKCHHYFYEIYTDSNRKNKIEFVLNDALSIFTNAYGGVIISDKERNICKQIHGHYSLIKKMIYLDNYNMLLSLDENGICLKWLITEYELIGNLKPELKIDDIWASDNSSNVIVKTKDFATYDLININGTVLQANVLNGLHFTKVLGFAVISNDLKVAFPDIIDYLLLYNENQIELHEIIVSSRGEFQLKKCLIDVDLNIKEVTNLQGHLDRDTKNNSHLKIKIQYQKRDSHGILNYEL